MKMCEARPTNVCVCVCGRDEGVFYDLAVEPRWSSSFASAGRQLLLKAVNRVWTELMHSKRQMLEDIFKVSLPCNDRGHVDIVTARPALEELALKSWQNHLGEEVKLPPDLLLLLHNLILRHTLTWCPASRSCCC